MTHYQQCPVAYGAGVQGVQKICLGGARFGQLFEKFGQYLRKIRAQSKKVEVQFFAVIATA